MPGTRRRRSVPPPRLPEPILQRASVAPTSVSRETSSDLVAASPAPGRLPNSNLLVAVGQLDCVGRSERLAPTGCTQRLALPSSSPPASRAVTPCSRHSDLAAAPECAERYRVHHAVVSRETRRYSAEALHCGDELGPSLDSLRHATRVEHSASANHGSRHIVAIAVQPPILPDIVSRETPGPDTTMGAGASSRWVSAHLGRSQTSVLGE